MKRFWPYFGMLSVCGLAVLFAAYTGMSLFFPESKAAASPPVVHYIIAEAAPSGDVPDPVPDTASGPGPVATERWLTEGGRVLFVGNSLVQGLQSADGYAGSSFICKKGLSLTGLLYILPDGSGADCDVAVVEMGSNELGLWSEEDFKASYNEALDRLSCRAVCLSVPPVCGAKSRYAARVSSENAALCSGWIEDICSGRDDAVYLDCSDFFGEALDPAWTGDGLHLTGDAYQAWHSWIMAELQAERPVE